MMENGWSKREERILWARFEGCRWIKRMKIKNYESVWADPHIQFTRVENFFRDALEFSSSPENYFELPLDGSIREDGSS